MCVVDHIKKKECIIWIVKDLCCILFFLWNYLYIPQGAFKKDPFHCVLVLHQK
jgi:hypothetical protein